MLSKIFSLAVLCSVVLLANAALEPRNSLRIQQTAGDKVKVYFQKLNEGTKNLFNKVNNAWHTFWDRVTGQESKRKQQEIEALKAELLKLQLDSSRHLSAVKAEWQAKLQAQEEELERLRDDWEQLAKAKERLKLYQAQAATAINGVINAWDQKADNLGDRIENMLPE